MSTKIEWADETVNPFVGCSKVSPGCKNCYALKMAHRLSYNPDPATSDKYKGTTETIRGKIQWTGRINHNLHCLEKLFAGTRGKKVFVGSMGDIAHPNVTFDLFTRIMDKCYSVNNRRIHSSDGKKEAHTFLFLTKRPDRFAALWEMYHKSQLLKDDWDDWEYQATQNDVYRTFWVGTSIEDQDQANRRIPHLLSIPVNKRFVSIEPMLDPVDLTQFVWTDINDNIIKSGENKLDWVICGGESGQQARPVHPSHLRSLRDQCCAAGIPFFFKQWGEWMTPEDAIMKGKSFVKQIAGNKRHIHEDGTIMIRSGKKNAGRLLDGKEHLEWSA